MNSDEIQIQIFADWLMSDAKRVTKDNRKNPEYHVGAAIRKMGAEKSFCAHIKWTLVVVVPFRD